jgi:hypothetical protein
LAGLGSSRTCGVVNGVAVPYYAPSTRCAPWAAQFCTTPRRYPTSFPNISNPLLLILRLALDVEGSAEADFLHPADPWPNGCSFPSALGRFFRSQSPFFACTEMTCGPSTPSASTGIAGAVQNHVRRVEIDLQVFAIYILNELD